MNRRTLKGFTFLELLIAVTIFSIVAVAIYSSFNVGIRAWRKTEDSYKVRQEARHALDMMARDLRCAIKFTQKDPENPLIEIDSFDGSASEVSLWRATTEGVFKITYKLVKEEDDDSKSLYRISQTYGQLAKDEPGSSSIVVGGLSNFELKYAFKNEEKIEWGSDWQGQGANIPLGARVILYFPTGDKEKSVGFSETILIPTGTIEKEETTSESS